MDIHYEAGIHEVYGKVIERLKAELADAEAEYARGYEAGYNAGFAAGREWRPPSRYVG